MAKQITRQNFEIAREANLRLTGGQMVWGELKNGDNSPKNPWAALHAANQIFTENPKSFFMVSLYNEIRTFFEKNY